MIEEYLNVWRSSLKIEESLSRKSFWMFFGINYAGLQVLVFIVRSIEIELFFGLIPLIVIGFHLALLSAGIRRMNDIKRPISFIFIPLYNIYLCLLPSSEKDAVVNPNRITSISKIFKLHLASSLIGVLGFISIALIDFGGGYGALFVYLMVIAICVIVIPIIITICILFLHDNKKNVITHNYLIKVFLIIGVITIIYINVLARLVT